MAELRKHPLTNDWIMIASHRQGRPQMPKDYCPFCPGSGKVRTISMSINTITIFPPCRRTRPFPIRWRRISLRRRRLTENAR